MIKLKILISFVLFILMINPFDIEAIAQDSINNDQFLLRTFNKPVQPLYSALPNHRELVIKSLELAFNTGYIDTLEISYDSIKERLEAGAYSEDFEAIPGNIGSHFPAPWNQGPEFDFSGYYPFVKIPYGSYRNTSSGWFRGFNHGYDPIQRFNWPGSSSTTVEWANSSFNSFIWSNALNLYNSGYKAEAYQCLGHLLHLLADLSIPSHVKVVNHGIDVVELNSGTVLDPDKLEIIVDEYELALAGGIIVPGIVYIPSILNEFRSAINLADTNNIPWFTTWQEYLTELGKLTYNHPLVNQFYVAPTQNGSWGSTLDENGAVKNPITYATIPLTEINGEWFELKIKSTATATGSILSEDKMIEMCNDLVSKAVEYGAGLILKFFHTVTDIEPANFSAQNFLLYQNYPNPFNPRTKIIWYSPVSDYQTLKVYDILGRDVMTLVDEYRNAGKYETEIDASQLSSGIYFYQLKVADFTSTKKMMLLK